MTTAKAPQTKFMHWKSIEDAAFAYLATITRSASRATTGTHEPTQAELAPWVALRQKAHAAYVAYQKSLPSGAS